jgi:hypothetical protein
MRAELSPAAQQIPGAEAQILVVESELSLHINQLKTVRSLS